jgi:hypothetical protein
MSTYTTAIPESKFVRERLGQLLRLLASDKDGEVVAAARAIERTLHAIGADFHDLAHMIEAPPLQPVQPLYGTSWQRMAQFCAARRPSLNSRELKFVLDMVSWRGEPSDAQEDWLIAIYERLCREGQR